MGMPVPQWRHELGFAPLFRCGFQIPPCPPEKQNPIPSIAIAFARFLKRLRQQSGLKMYVAAETLGVCKSTWSQWESGKRFPSAEMLAAIAACLHVKPCLLLGAVDCKCLPPCSQGVNPKALRTVPP